MAQFDIVQHTIASNVAFGGSFSVNYPTNKAAEDYAAGTDHRINSLSNRQISTANGEFSVSFGVSTFTVTINTNMAYTAGEKVFIQLALSDRVFPRLAALADQSSMTEMQIVKLDLGTPIASDSDGAVASQSATLASGLATGINGALAADGVATFDVPRNVVAAWTNAAVITVTGTDAYGAVLVESSGSGTSFTGKKAFKTVTDVTVSANVTGLTVGTSKVLGLPVFVGAVADVIREYQDGAAPTAGTVVAGVTAAATATTGDVRGTYAPNGTPNGSLRFEVAALVRSTAFKGVAQFAG